MAFYPPTQPFYVTGNYYSAVVMDWRTKCSSGIHVGGCSGSALTLAEHIASLLNAADGNQGSQEHAMTPSVSAAPSSTDERRKETR